MKIIIEVKGTATLDRIDQLDKVLNVIKGKAGKMELDCFEDVIKSISKEWCS